MNHLYHLLRLVYRSIVHHKDRVWSRKRVHPIKECVHKTGEIGSCIWLFLYSKMEHTTEGYGRKDQKPLEKWVNDEIDTLGILLPLTMDKAIVFS